MLPWRLSLRGIFSKPWSATIAGNVQHSPENFSLWYLLSLVHWFLHLSMKSPQVHNHKKVDLTLSVPYWNLPLLWKVGCTLTRSTAGLQSIGFSADPLSNYKCQRPAPKLVPIFCSSQHPTSVGVATIFRYTLSGTSVRLVCTVYIVSHFLMFCRK